LRLAEGEPNVKLLIACGSPRWGDGIRGRGRGYAIGLAWLSERGTKVPLNAVHRWDCNSPIMVTLCAWGLERGWD